MVRIAISYQEQPSESLCQLPNSWRRFHMASKPSEAPRPATQPKFQNLAPPPKSFSGGPRQHHSSDPEPGPQTHKGPATQRPAEIQGFCAHVRRQCAAWTLSGFLRDPQSQSDTVQQFLLNHDLGGVGFSQVTRPLVLKSLFTNQQAVNNHQPTFALSSEQRYGIAAALCWSVLHLSGSPWLREEWGRLQAKILLHKTNNGREILSHHPSISCHLPSEPAPQQPLTCGTETTIAQSFSHLIPNKLVFELGILLIELCMNKPFVELRGDSSGGQSLSTPLEDYSTAARMIDEVRNTIGNGYGDAVQLCVKFVFRGLERPRTLTTQVFVASSMRRWLHRYKPRMSF
ncbi:hypothetical protein B0T14DRAFT_589250, partial [Immersiella caudata]